MKKISKIQITNTSSDEYLIANEVGDVIFQPAVSARLAADEFVSLVLNDCGLTSTPAPQSDRFSVEISGKTLTVSRDGMIARLR